MKHMKNAIVIQVKLSNLKITLNVMTLFKSIVSK